MEMLQVVAQKFIYWYTTNKYCYNVCFYIAGTDYNATNSVCNVTISAGTTSTSFDIDITNDTIYEDIETFTIAIRILPSNLLLSLCIESSIVRIVDKDSKQLLSSN